MFTDTDQRLLVYTIPAITVGLILGAVVVGAVVILFVLKRRKRELKKFPETIHIEENTHTDVTTVVLQERSMNVTYNAYEDVVCIMSLLSSNGC
jgi:uncharacterized protein (DUF58 family)